MSGIRSLHRNPTVKGSATAASAPIYVNSNDNLVKVIPAGTGSTEIPLMYGAATGSKIASGLATFVSGAVTVATGLATVTGFALTLIATGFATGATEVTNAVETLAPATGAVSVQGYRLMTTTASASGTGQFQWIAVGT